MTVLDLTTSFAAGELSPTLYARVDLAKYHVGAARVYNFFCDYRGGVSTRPGSHFIQPVKNSDNTTRLIPFIVSDLTSYVIELGQHYARFYSNGAPLVEDGMTITDAPNGDPLTLEVIGHGYNNSDWVFVSGMHGMTELNERTFSIEVADADHFRLISLYTGNSLNGHTMGTWTSGGTTQRIYELATPWRKSDLHKLKFAQSADVLTVTHPAYTPYDIARLTLNTFSVTAFDPGPKVAAPAALTGIATDGGHTLNQRYGYVVTAQDETGKEESLPSTSFELLNNFLIQNDSPPVMNNLTWNAVEKSSYYNIYKWGGIPSDQPSQTVFGFIGQAVAPQFTDNNIAPDIARQPPQFRNPFAGGAITALAMDVHGTGYTSVPAVALGGDGIGGSAHAVLDNGGVGVVTHIIIDDGGSGYTVAGATITISGGGGAGATAHVTQVSSDADLYPSVVSYYQQRRVFAATNANPEGLWFSQIGLINNFDVSPAVLDNEAVTASLASLQVNAIMSLVPTSQGLVAFTSGGVWLISGKTAQDAITPTSISALPQASPGAAALPPIVVNTNILYIQYMNSAVRDVAFDINSFSLVGKDRSELAMHLFFGHSITEWCLAEEPFHLVYCVRDDGFMLTLTYTPQNDIYAWAQQATRGYYKSVCSVPEPPTNAVYTIVSRLIRDRWFQYVERIVERDWETVEFAWCVDCGLRRPVVNPHGSLTLNALSGNGILAVSDSTVFDPGDVGKVIRGGGGRATITSYTSSTRVHVNINNTFEATIPEQPHTPRTLESGEWSLMPVVTEVGGLEHLALENVDVLADGLVYKNLPVDGDGTLTLVRPASLITIGYAFTAQLQTLNLDMGDPTIQTKYKVLPTITLRVEDTRALFAGPDFGSLLEVPMDNAAVTPIPLFTGDLRVNINNSWNRRGRICVETTDPLPATVSGIISEVQLGSD